MGFWLKLRNSLFPERQAREVDEELRFHLEMSAQERGGQRPARLRFGSPGAVREETREAGVFRWVDSLRQDVRYGLRQIARSPLLSAAILISLAAGIGANTAIFTIADAVLLKSLPVRDPQSLRVIQWRSETGFPQELATGHSGTFDGDPRGVVQASSFGPATYRALAAGQTAMEGVIGFSDSGEAAAAVRDSVAERVFLQYVSSNFFSVLGVTPDAGRAIQPADDQIGAEPVVVVSHRYWQTRLGGRGDAVGEIVRVNNVPVRVVGVAPPGFFGLRIGGWTDMYAAIAARGSISVTQRGVGEDNQQWWVRMVARLRPDADSSATLEQLSALYQRLVVPAGVEVDAAKIPKLVADPGRRGADPMGGDSAVRLWILLLLSGLVLLIVCANIANLLLARALGRQRESAVRRALGATRLRVLRQQFVESCLLAAIGGLLGLGVGYLLTRVGGSLAQDAVGQIDAQFDLRVLGFTAGIALLTAVLFGLAPGLRAARSDWGEGLKSQSRSVFAGRLRLPRVLVVVQLALCVTVIAAAGLLVRTLANLRTVDIGFDRANIVYASVNPWQAGYEPERVSSYVDRLRRDLSGQPGVLAVATVGNRPLSGAGSWTAAGFPGRPSVADGSNDVMINAVSDGLFETLGVSVLAGRSLDAGDMRPGADAAVVNQAFAERFFPDQNPLGQRFGTGGEPIDTEAYQIVGIVGNSSYNSLREEVGPAVYRPLVPGDRRGAATNLVIRAAVDSAQLASMLRNSAASIDATVPLDEIQTQTALVDRLLRNERLLSTLSAAFGTLALGLAAVGLGGLLAYAVARRRNEIGVRMALGAAPGDVARMVLSETLRLVALGAIIGLPGAYGIGRLLEGTLYGLEPADPSTAAAALAVLGSVAVMAAWLPARRAARIDPVRALREE